MVGNIWRTTGTCRHRSYSGTSCSPLKYLSCGQPCSMACTTNWSPLTEVSLWDCYIIAGKWRRASLFNCDTANPNVAIIFVAEPPLCSETSEILSEVFHWKGQTLLLIYLYSLSSADWIKQCLLNSLCAELILDDGTLPYRVCSLISRMSVRSLSEVLKLINTALLSREFSGTGSPYWSAA